MGAEVAEQLPQGDDFAWSLLDAAPDATLVVSPTGEIVFANHHAGALFGSEPGDLVGRSVEQLLPDELRAVHRAHRTRYRADPVNRPMGSGLDLEARRADGSRVPVEVSLSPLQIGDEMHVIAAVRDVSARVAADEWMHRVLRTLDASPDGVFIFDAETLQYSFVNDGACRLVGYERDELLSMTPLHLNPAMSRAEYQGLVAELVASDDGRLRQSTLMRRDGLEVPVEKAMRSAPPGRDGTAWIIVFARDITERRAAEAALEAKRRALEEAEQTIAVAADRERIARDLHDTVIQRIFAEGLNLQSALSMVGDPVRLRERVQATIDGLDSTIMDLRTAIFALHHRPTAPMGGVRGRFLEVVDVASPGLGFEVRLQFDGAIEVLDGHVVEEMEHVLREALSNVTRHARATSVRVSVTADDGYASVVVRDDGVGIPQDVVGGNGLRNITDRASGLGGDATIESVAEGGSELRWRVPI
jgi:PAS domain S-box-containing protein